MQNTKTMSDTEPAKKGFTQLVQKDIRLHSAGPEGFRASLNWSRRICGCFVSICFCIENTLIKRYCTDNTNEYISLICTIDFRKKSKDKKKPNNSKVFWSNKTNWPKQDNQITCINRITKLPV